MTLLLAQQNDLKTLEGGARLRRLQPRTGLDFSSNDYLGLARAERLRGAVAAALARGVSIGSGGSRLLRGNDPEHEALEAEAAAFFGSEGMRLARAESVATPHNDATAIDQAITDWRRRGGTGRAWIAVESLYSMDGDRAPLADLAAVAARHAAMLLIDEAHATGVFGPGGRGLAADLEGAENVITLRTCGKALGCEGALLCGPRTMRDFLVNRGRAFIFSTAPSPLMASAVRESLRILADEPERRDRLSALTAFAERTLAPCGVTPTGSQILPLVIGEDAPTMQLAAALQAAGFDIRGIRPPTVPPGTARLRVSLTLNVGEAEIAALAETLLELRAREP